MPDFSCPLGRIIGSYHAHVDHHFMIMSTMSSIIRHHTDIIMHHRYHDTMHMPICIRLPYTIMVTSWSSSWIIITRHTTEHTRTSSRSLTMATIMGIITDFTIWSHHLDIITVTIMVITMALHHHGHDPITATITAMRIS
ncbi:hypothetical protein AVEN_137553-1 [Araneus ventricosus]|uniref:Uncharacterized protein n=1 Tax=Araneus ventricosus TaxID=182803 RepID=A0A4Y2FN43_ARAVE|nr:hypothetical protein AVEN_137553-1 [Araneus ventricosus]